MNSNSFLLISAVSVVVASSPFAPSLAQSTVISSEAKPGVQTAIDYTNAKPMEKLVQRAPTYNPVSGDPGPSGVVEGSEPKEVFRGKPVTLPKRKGTSDGVDSQAYGTFKHPFSTSRVQAKGLGNPSLSSKFPYRPAGQLAFNTPFGSFVCSASVIKDRVVVTAAHCVSEFGSGKFYTDFEFTPALEGTSAPYGVWTYKKVFALKSYLNGTDSCAVPGIVCENDVAVLVMNDLKGQKIGNVTGKFGYGFGKFGYGYTNFLGNVINQLTQLGYPCGLDNCSRMEKNESFSYIDASSSDNQVIGSLMDGGSSGGPWLVNHGIPPALTGVSGYGAAHKRNIVTGVTSWGYVSDAIKEQGASPFKSTNIKALVDKACAEAPGNC
ncbi:MAG: trypsin-like serine protease [Thermosynechococcaceae cyanobacterium]